MCTQTPQSAAMKIPTRSRSLNAVTAPHKTVTFNESVRVKYTMHLNEYTDQEYFDCWNDEQDMLSFRQDIKNQLRDVRLANIPFIPRGLESRTKEGSALKRQHKHAAWDAVFLAQDCQQAEGTCDDLLIAAPYTAACLHSRAQATVRGRLDEQVVRQGARKMRSYANNDEDLFSLFADKQVHDVTATVHKLPQQVSTTRTATTTTTTTTTSVKSILKKGSRTCTRLQQRQLKPKGLRVIYGKAA